MRHLYESRCEVLRLSGVMIDGSPVQTWTKVAAVVDPLIGTTGEFLCRLDLVFQRPGKDQPMAIVAGRAPDRIGVMFFDATDAVKAGDRIRCIAGPVTGTFEIRTIPDTAVGFAVAHHCEVQVIEVSQTIRGLYPAATVEG